MQEYTVTGNNCALNTPLAAGAVCTITVTFTPGYPGVRAVPLIVATSLGTFRYGLSGLGTGPQIGFSPALITTTVGHQPGTAGFGGDNGPATGALLHTPFNAVSDYAGNLYIADVLNDVIRRVDAITGIITTIAGTPGQSGSTGDGGLATAAKITFIGGPALDSAGDIYFVDIFNHVVRRIDAATGIISTVVGTIGSQGHTGDGGLAANALLNTPTDIVFDSAGDMYIAEEGNSDVRRVDGRTSIITRVAGASDYASGYSGDGGPATSAHLSNPLGVQFDSAGDMYIDDDNNNVIRKVDAATGIISTPIGIYTPTGGFSGNGGSASAAYLNDPQGFSIDAANNIYIGDASNNDIRKVYAATGVISTIAGIGNPNVSGYTGDGGPATLALLNYPAYPKLDNAGNLFISDSLNQVIRKLSGVAPLSFAATYVGSSATAQDVTITNSGNAALVLTALAFPPDFNLSGADTTCSATTSLAPGGSCILGVVFQPATAGAVSESLTLIDNLGTQNVPVSGTGLTLATTTTTLAASSTTPVYGQSVTLTATVSPTPTGSALGTINFFSGTTLLGTGTVNSSGVATLTTINLPGGTNAVTAVYSGNAGFATSTSAATTFTVAAQAVVLVASIVPSSPSYGQAASLNISDAANGTPVAGALITAIVNRQTFTCTTSATGQCTINLVAGVLQGGADSIAITSAATTLAPAGSTTLAVTVAAAMPTIAVAASPAPLTYGQAATVAVTEIIGALPIAGSTATVTVDGHVYSCVTSAEGICTVNLPGGVLAGGTNSIAVATGATANSIAGTATASANVAVASTSVTAIINPLQPAYGQAATITIAVLTNTPDSPPLPVAGAVETVTIGGGSYTCTSDATGHCQSVLPAGTLPGGMDILSIASAATGNTTTGTGSLSVTVGPAPTVLTLGSSSTQVVAGTPITLTGTVSAMVPGTPTGTVTFFANSSPIGTGTVSSGAASLTLSTLAVGANAISATYSGAPSFLPSSASGFTQTVLVNFTIVITGGTPGSTPTQTILPGGTAVFPLTLGIVNGFVGPVTMSASGLPPGATASFNPTVVNLDGIHPASTVLSIAMADTVGQATQPSIGTPGTKTNGGTQLAFALLLTPVFWLRKIRRHLGSRRSTWLLGLIAAVTLGALTSGLSGCGTGGYFGPGPKSYAITVTATSGSLNHSTTVTLNVR